MGYALLWLVTLVLALLLAATLLACAARLPSRGRRAFWSAGAVVLPLVGLATLTAIGGYLQFEVRATAVLFWPLLVISLGYAAGGLSLLRWAVSAPDAGGATGASRWPRGKLALATAVAAVLGLITFWSLDLAQLQRLAVLRAEVGTLALSVAPARVPARENAAVVYERAFDAMLEEPPPPEPSRGEPTLGPSAYRSRGAPMKLAKGWEERFANWVHPESERSAEGVAEGAAPAESGDGAPEDGAFNADDPALRKFLDIQRPAVALLLEGSSRPECSFEHDYIWPSMNMLLPELTDVRTAGWVLVLDARVRAADGDIRGALERLNAVLRLGDHVGREPTIINVLVGAAMDGIAFTWIPRILAPFAVDEEALGAIRLPEDSVSYRKRFRQALRMEEAFALATICDIAEGRVEGLSWPVPEGSWLFLALGSLYRVFLLPEDVAAYRSTIGSYQDLILLPYPESNEGAKAVEERFRGGTRGLFTGMIAPALSGALRYAPEGDARRACLAAYLAVLRYRAQTGGHYPTTLDDLVPGLLPSVPIDPFDGKPLRYRREGLARGAEQAADRPAEGFVIYSIGRDGKDDGGAPYDGSEGTGDIAIRWGGSAR